MSSVCPYMRLYDTIRPQPPGFGIFYLEFFIYNFFYFVFSSILYIHTFFRGDFNLIPVLFSHYCCSEPVVPRIINSESLSPVQASLNRSYSYPVMDKLRRGKRGSEDTHKKNIIHTVWNTLTPKLLKLGNSPHYYILNPKLFYIQKWFRSDADLKCWFAKGWS